MSTMTRYFLFQIPGWLVFTLVLVGVHDWFGMPGWLVGVLSLAWIAKDAALYPLVKTGYEPEKTGTDRLIGLIGTVQKCLGPIGYVRIRGELWRAEAESAARTIRRELCPQLQG